MSTTKRDDMRALLKSFGIQADETVIAHLAKNPQIESLHLRLSLIDLTDYGNVDIDGELTFELDGHVGRGS